MADTSTTVRLIEDFVQVDPLQVESLLDRYPDPLTAIQALSNRRHQMYLERARNITSYNIDMDHSDPWIREMALICAATRQAWDRRRRELKGKDASAIEPKSEGRARHQERP